MIFKEIQGSNYQLHSQITRRLKYYLDMVIDLSRILELLTRWAPELFLSKERIHASRVLDYMAFVLKSIFQMNMDQILDNYLKKLQIKSKSLAAFLTPFVGIQVNLYRAIKILKGEQMDKTAKFDFDAFVQHTLSDDMEKLESLMAPYAT